MKRLKLYNTESREKEEILKPEGRPLLMYTCGPTVYNFAHIGNFRTYVFEDLLRRTLKFFGYPLRQVMNITDIDDKTIRGAIAQGVSLKEYTEPYTAAFFEDLQTLSIEPVEEYPRATEYVKQMIEMIQKHIDLGYAYKGADGSIYFSIGAFPSYGRLSHLHLGELKEGASERVGSDEYDKESAADFVLWKAYDKERDGDTFWESPFGRGRPGWHIECSAMSMQLLGESIDIHVGGVDNIFPHHENEIAQSEAYSGKRFVRHWLHAEHLLVDHKKMSKSLGNFYTLRDLFAKGYTGKEVRTMLLQSHYRTQLNFTFEGLQAARHALQRLEDFVTRLRAIDAPQEGKGSVQPLIARAEEAFSRHLADDLNISAALSALFELVREVNALCDEGGVGVLEAKLVLESFERFDRVLALLPLHPEEGLPPVEIQEALKMRSEARANKKWAEADRYRLFIEERGYLIEDTAKGPRVKKQKL